MTAPEITAALEALIASTPPPVTVWGVRYAKPAGHIVWHDSETDARAALAGLRGYGYSGGLVSITGHVRVHPADATVTDGGAR